MNLREVERHRVGDAAVVGLRRGDRADAGALGAELGLDTTHGPQLAPFYAALLGGTVDDGEPVDPSGQMPTV
jgi:4a-hydroxytetrahydrobiopterin dehydratase